jgi:uncharacterized Zn-finger protein
MIDTEQYARTLLDTRGILSRSKPSECAPSTTETPKTPQEQPVQASAAFDTTNRDAIICPWCGREQHYDICEAYDHEDMVNCLDCGKRYRLVVDVSITCTTERLEES